MKTKEKCSVWARVTISPSHALRANQSGLIIDEQRHGQKRWLVKFDECYPGGVIDVDMLWIDEHDFTEVITDAETRSQDFSLLGELH